MKNIFPQFTKHSIITEIFTNTVICLIMKTSIPEISWKSSLMWLYFYIFYFPHSSQYNFGFDEHIIKEKLKQDLKPEFVIISDKISQWNKNTADQCVYIYILHNPCYDVYYQHFIFFGPIKFYENLYCCKVLSLARCKT